MICSIEHVGKRVERKKGGVKPRKGQQGRKTNKRKNFLDICIPAMMHTRTSTAAPKMCRDFPQWVQLLQTTRVLG